MLFLNYRYKDYFHCHFTALLTGEENAAEADSQKWPSILCITILKMVGGQFCVCSLFVTSQKADLNQSQKSWRYGLLSLLINKLGLPFRNYPRFCIPKCTWIWTLKRPLSCSVCIITNNFKSFPTLEVYFKAYMFINLLISPSL